MQEIINRINNLSLESNEEEVEELLSELKKSLIQNPDVSKSILNANFINSIENWIQLDNVVLICQDILDISLSHFKITDSDSFGTIELLLKSSPPIKEIVIRKLQHDYQAVSAFVPKSTILLLIKCLNSENVNVGPATINLLIEFLREDLLNDGDVIHQLSMDTSKTEVKCRMYEVCVGIGIKNFKSFEKIQFIIEKCLTELTSGSDVLLQLNLLEILQNLCLRDYGFAYLENKNVMQNLARKIESINEDPLSTLLLPGLMKFFGGVAALYPQKIFQRYSTLFDLLFHCILENHLSLIYSALDTLGYLSKSDDCKKLMDKDFGNKFVQALAHIYQKFPNYPNDVKLRALACLNNAFALDEEEEMINNQISSICEKWCIGIFGNSKDFSSLLNICKTPFDDLSTAAFQLVKSLAVYSFGQEGIAKTGGFVEFLLDRKNGSCFELKQKKFEVIELLARSSVFDATSIAKFCKYLREGINYVEPMSEVCLESS
ncbi:26S proteasome non-ATPase regulatory subunit 5 [Chironomus tepperi]|uniref:26S proteasome non-ATPase regulatory subunit 5 n=1 Tax=Chironomus tepperi TaxID=113505 RepID=UPI00391FC6A8